ncbi:P63C domain-containing protein [Lelliottia wanjuensis]|uniref:P63C domain-containing protein n=1 Tax=Lelliottia wanjuensis TaxID=3050585 RepID=A0AAP4LC32_9ENTR|nr:MULTISPECIES: P63C domain-containing protein [unclassified Lelliottia]MDK9365370.1 P63C domain-containing protein [Lelliottia sp. V106_12]MDK9617903.1 P63C domain-containing protein [Lelliottia sp. V106_9]
MDILKAIAGANDTPLQLGDSTLECYVLEDGSRVFSGNGLQKALKFPGSAGGSALVKMLNAGKLSEKLTIDIIDKINNRKEFARPGSGGRLSKTYGYDATLLIDICNLLIQCREQGILTPKQDEYARTAQTIISSVAKVGIIGLIDEVTGYQHQREKDELQKILQAYIAEDLLPWQKRFPDIFYRELFRLNGWDYTLGSIKKRPGVIGTWTNKLIYEQLPPGVLKELKERTPKSAAGNATARYHQSLTEDIGEPNLSAQINKTVTLFQLSDNMAHMWKQFKKLQERQAGQEQLDMPFSFDENGHTKDDK